MNNYESVKAVVEAMVDPHRFKLSPESSDRQHGRRSRPHETVCR